MEKMTSKKITEAMDMMVRMQFMESIDNSVKEMCKAYKKIDFEHISIDKLKEISESFENIVKIMGTE